MIADESVEKKAREIVYSGKYQAEMEQLCEGTPWVGEELERIVFEIKSTLTHLWKKRKSA